jgi:predicted ester cyclase
MNENKTLVTDYLRALTGQAKTPDMIGKYVADEALATHIADLEAAFPKYELLAEEIIGEGDLVVVRAEFRGVHRGPFAGIEPSGRSVSAGLIIIYKVQNRKIVNHWMQFDTFSLLQQLNEAHRAVGASQL